MYKKLEKYQLHVEDIVSIEEKQSTKLDPRGSHGYKVSSNCIFLGKVYEGGWPVLSLDNVVSDLAIGSDGTDIEKYLSTLVQF